MTVPEKIDAGNQIKTLLHQYGPFREEPVDCLQWVPADQIHANDYNPNHVAPPEKRLLYTSLMRTGFTHPLVTWRDEDKRYTLIDGFHRFSLTQQRKALRQRLHGYLPVVAVNHARQDKSQHIAATIRHNRARGQHQIQAMSSVVQELARLGWDDRKIAVELGMEADEVLRLKQISGLMEMFQEREFSTAWTVK
ncbi:IbrB-like domain-containing protein [Klebsiella quasipneumoniae]|uniref:IbrB-like domain-containing protein n=1 Tax=Klebsiella quasipneumoniae TaxID=1463165 RepID=UPI0009447B77|nr:ParB/RepB/Spo0J family partition protein [Klebsiella quasipneumoniae]MCL8071140.1 ParB/RepB/Spo0J family partition protein [Klebsiella quasipneumoniae]MDE4782348.1 ParB/RepB/Spo0J family partition protein [Klebsiella quasipneumoniae subsp. similipneumoniae]MDM7373308.1 ParB/RepB/Spo0J family partition protein [Klebsiella quasipneumoniae]